MKTIKDTLKNQIGMSLAETLAAVLIMSFVTLGIAAGISAGTRVYKKISGKAEAQTLLATNIAALSEYFETSDQSISFNETDGITIGYSEVVKGSVTIYNNGSKGIYLLYDNGSISPLISEKANTSGYYAAIDSFSTENGITNMQVTIYQDGTAVNESETVSIRNTTKVPAE